LLNYAPRRDDLCVSELHSSTLLNLGARWRWRSTSLAGHFTELENPWYPLYRRLGGPQSLDTFAKRKIPYYCPPGTEPQSSWNDYFIL